MAPMISLLSFIVNWNSIESVQKWSECFDYSGALDFVVALLAIISIAGWLKGKRKKIVEWATAILALIAGACWVVDSKLDHRLSALQQQESIKSETIESDKLRAAQQQVDELRSAVQWRTISPEQEERIINLLRPFMRTNFMFANKVIVIPSTTDNPEIQSYAERFCDVLGKCGFEPFLSTGHIENRNSTGIEFLVQSLHSAPAHAIAIFNAFQETKIAWITASEPPSDALRSSAQDCLVIFVFPKPEK